VAKQSKLDGQKYRLQNCQISSCKFKLQTIPEDTFHSNSVSRIKSVTPHIKSSLRTASENSMSIAPSAYNLHNDLYITNIIERREFLELFLYGI